jgi:hypothetical protein
MRHSFNIVVALLSMAAGAWQGTTAHSEQPGPTAHGSAAGRTPKQIVLHGCVEKGVAPGTYLLVTPEPVTERNPDGALLPGAPPQPEDGTSPARADSPGALKAAYEIVSGTPAVDVARLVGKRVEVRGAPEQTAPGASDSPEAAAAAADAPSDGPLTDTSGRTPQRLRVRITSLGPVAGPCE